ncbi:hypothetical protein PAAG_12630 [Paracoccidioides lutzii Pb01]|uniref:Uncharacterized protein n=1 Tax=Paracoccidioides lutzii (strain ATCC MYA-826 / Pb01) TaxID=502779 RepID=A0A0A2V2X5_PARBA|nr:hypothetical protein PAAG_12630 [Paracoccidioides lutzii Pb01]KGQ00697.1 hypothetical protein PAAG_12630 [Paracoccidioides lutzii Pb01]
MLHPSVQPSVATPLAGCWIQATSGFADVRDFCHWSIAYSACAEIGGEMRDTKGARENIQRVKPVVRLQAEAKGFRVRGGGEGSEGETVQEGSSAAGCGRAKGGKRQGQRGRAKGRSEARREKVEKVEAARARGAKPERATAGSTRPMGGVDGGTPGPFGKRREDEAGCSRVLTV